MKKIISTLVVLFAVFGAQYASACSQTQESMTGGACSIKDLQNLEKSKKQESNFDKTDQDLKPVKSSPEKQKSGCELFGLCLREHLKK